MRIVCIVGASGSGKSTIAEQLGGNVIQSYTTRPMRFEGETGHEFISNVEFVGDDIIIYDLQGHTRRLPASEIVAYAKLYGEHYFALREQFEASELNIYVVNPAAAEDVHKYFDAGVKTLYIQVDEAVRKDRMISRYSDAGYSFDEINDEVQTRLAGDRQEFAGLACNWVVDGNGSEFDVIRGVRRWLTSWS